MILAACLFGTIGISFCYLSLFTDYHIVCSFVAAAFKIKAGPFALITPTAVSVPLDFDIIVAIALLVTNAVATLMILHKTWYHVCLFVAYKS